ncbi:MAG: peptidoglycan DD-metalloendopeptidase family protein [Patescibacteria group bacterium]|jgi:murein DD-endopeptidase MepM/ murein hydrolase activator NlpD|nr:peptidoglycan DD-metalloendopeptidase family protein [Patescibacteria group bacterium]
MKKILFLLSLILVTGVIVKTSSFAYLAEEEDDYSNPRAAAINNELKTINSEIEDRKNRMKKLDDKEKSYTQAIAQKQKDKSTLNSQLAILDNRLAKAEIDIESVELDIEKVSLEISKTNISIENKTEEIASEKEKIEKVIQLLYKEGNTDTLQILLLNNSLSDFLTQVKYLENVNQAVKESLDNLIFLKDNLEEEKVVLGEKNDETVSLKESLIDKKKALEAELGGKEILLVQVNSSESEYQRLLAASKAEQQEAASEIASMEKLIRAKLATLSGKELEFNENGLVWPVKKNVITSYFHDPDYPYRHIFEHPAIDIRAGQGSTLKAAASGYVARAKNAGMGYSYIMIVHGDGLSTVYGHVSKILINEDDYVVQGQTIGLSGGMPGTPGAGRLTTGPHLHFEVRKDGIPVNPLNYLK